MGSGCICPSPGGFQLQSAYCPLHGYMKPGHPVTTPPPAPVQTAPDPTPACGYCGEPCTPLRVAIATYAGNSLVVEERYYCSVRCLNLQEWVREN